MKLAKELLTRSDWLILDTETTGLDDDAEAVQIGLLSPTGEVLLDTLVRPTRPIPPSAQAIHGITDEMVSNAPSFREIYPRLVKLTEGKEIWVYNASYDYRILVQSAYKSGVLTATDVDDFGFPELNIGRSPGGWFCFMQAYADFWGEWDDYHGNYRWQRLTNACYQQRIKVEDAHSAIGDCRMTLALIRKLGGE